MIRCTNLFISRSMWDSRTTNLVAKIKAKPIELEYLQSIPNIRYNPAKFSAGFLRLSTGSCNIFRTGTIVFLGYKSPQCVRRGINELSQIMKDRINASTDFTICNIVTALTPKQPMQLKLSDTAEQITKAGFFDSVFYEPDLCNTLQLKLNSSKCTLLLHTTGKAIIAGAKSNEDVEEMIMLLAIAK